MDVDTFNPGFMRDMRHDAHYCVRIIRVTVKHSVA